jgi:hypothetical protein
MVVSALVKENSRDLAGYWKQSEFQAEVRGKIKKNQEQAINAIQEISVYPGGPAGALRGQAGQAGQVPVVKIVARDCAYEMNKNGSTSERRGVA